MEALAKASTLLAQIEAKLLKLAQRNLDHAAKHAEELGEDFQNKLDFLSEFDASKGNGWPTH